MSEFSWFQNFYSKWTLFLWPLPHTEQPCISYQHITHNIRFVFIPQGTCITVYFIKLYRGVIQEPNDALSLKALRECPTFPTCFRLWSKLSYNRSFYKTKQSCFLSWVPPALHCANTVDVSPIKPRSIRLWKEVVNCLCIACMRLCNQSWVARTVVESLPTWEKVKAQLVCYTCVQSLHAMMIRH